MTDFFSRLEDHLDDAARRQAASPRGARRAPRPTLRAVAVMAAVLAIVAAGVAAFPRLADDTERAADSGDKGWTSYVPLGCEDKDSIASPVAGGPFPEAVRERFAVLRAKGNQAEVEIEEFDGLPVWGVQVKEAVLALEHDFVRYYVVAVADVQEAPQDCGTVAERPASERVPGACLLLLGTERRASSVTTCWTLRQIEDGDSVIAPISPGSGITPVKDLTYVAALIPDGHETVSLFGQEPSPGDTNVVAISSTDLPSGPARWYRPGEAPADRGNHAPDNYGCDGPVHPETIATYPVLKNAPDEDRKLQAPEGTTFLSPPVLAREAFGHKFWLIPAADQADCAKPVICLATDAASTAVQCSPIDKEKSTPLLTRVRSITGAIAEYCDKNPEADGSCPTLIMFAAAPEGLGDPVLMKENIQPIDLSAKNNVLLAGRDLPDDEARRTAELIGGTTLPGDR